MLGKFEGKRTKGQQRTKLLDGITDSTDMSEQNLGDGEGQGFLVCCRPWGHKESDRTEQLNNNKYIQKQRDFSSLSSFFFNPLLSLSFIDSWHSKKYLSKRKLKEHKFQHHT